MSYSNFSAPDSRRKRLFPGHPVLKSISNVSAALIMTGVKILSWSMRKFVLSAICRVFSFDEQERIANSETGSKTSNIATIIRLHFVFLFISLFNWVC